MLTPLLGAFIHFGLLVTLVVNCWGRKKRKRIPIYDGDIVEGNKHVSWKHGSFEHNAELEKKKTESEWTNDRRPPLDLLKNIEDVYRKPGEPGEEPPQRPQNQLRKKMRPRNPRNEGIKVQRNEELRQAFLQNTKEPGVYHAYWPDFDEHGLNDLIRDAVNVQMSNTEYAYGTPTDLLRRMQCTIVLHGLEDPNFFMIKKKEIFHMTFPFETRGPDHRCRRYAVYTHDFEIEKTRQTIRELFEEKLKKMSSSDRSRMEEEFAKYVREERQDFFLCMAEVDPTNIKPRPELPKNEKEEPVEIRRQANLDKIDIYYGDMRTPPPAKNGTGDRCVYVYLYENRMKVSTWEWPWWMLQEELDKAKKNEE